MSAGLHSSAAISMDGQLWMWGKVISKVWAYSSLLLTSLLLTASSVQTTSHAGL